MSTETPANGALPARSGWMGHWPDALAFALGLGVAWWAGWETTDLVWSLWLSSLVVGYAMIVWSLLGPGSLIVRGVWRDRAMLSELPAGKTAAGFAVLTAGGMFLLAFFTFHFGMFHFVHSQFLEALFPLHPNGGQADMVGIGTYFEVVRRYWIFLPAAFLAERAAFRPAARAPAAPPDTAVTPEAIMRRKAAGANGFTGMMAPYKNVMRMHLLIFFFGFAHFVRLENFAVYAVVYAVYFFPWRVLKRS